MERLARYDDLVCFAFYRGWRLVQGLYAPLLDPEGLSPQRLYVLGLCDTGPITVGEIARRLHIDSPAISNLLRRMEADGLIARSRSAGAGSGAGGGDRRAVSVQATAAGRQALADLEAQIQAIDRRIEDGLSPEDRRALRNAVDHLAHLAAGAAAGPPGSTRPGGGAAGCRRIPE